MKVAIVTGANKGLGLAVVRALGRRLGNQAHIYLAARDEQRGRAAVELLKKEGLSPRFARMDLVDESSIAALASHIQAEHGGLDLLFHNGAYAAVPDIPGRQQVRLMINTNNVGTHRVLRAFAPLLRANARVVVVASGFGTLKSLHPSLHARFDTERMGLDDLETSLEAYVKAVEAGREAEEGWPSWINVPSKIGQVAAIRIFARGIASQKGGPPGILVNALCPGWLITDASRPYLKDLPKEVTPKQPDEVADDVLWPALLPEGATAPYGELIQFKKVLPWR